jgi:PAS domain S-box-containing protein
MMETLHRLRNWLAQPRGRTTLILVVVAVYVLMFVLLYPQLGSGVAALAVLPVALAGWLLGAWAGLLTGLLSFVLNTLLLNLAGAVGWDAVLRERGGPGAAAILLIGVTAGWLGTKVERSRSHARELVGQRAALQSQIEQHEQAEVALREREARFRTLIHELQVGVLLQGPATEILLANRAACNLLGLAEDQLIGKTSFAPGWDIIYEDGTPFPGAILPVPQAIATRQPVRNVVLGVARPTLGDRVWLLVHAEPQLAADGSVQQVICTFSDITDRKRAEAALRRRDAILEAVSFASARFLEAADWQQPILEILARFGLAAEVSRVYLFKNHLAPAGTLYTSQRYEWVAPGVAPQIDNPELQAFGFQAGGFGRWEALLGRGEVIHGHIRTFPDVERTLLESHDIRSVVVVPVFVGQDWWGHLGFDQCDRERDWSVAEIDALKAAAGILGATIQRGQSEQRSRELFEAARRQAQELALLDQVRTALARELDLLHVFRSVVEAIHQTFGYTQVSLYLLHDGVLHLQHQVGYERVIAEIPITRGVSGRVVRTGEPVLIEDVQGDPAFLGAIAGIVSEICVPLFDQGQVVGMLNVESVHDVVLHEADLRLVTAISMHVNIAIERARLYTTMREREQTYRSVVDNLKEVVFQISMTGHWTFLNPAWTEITGFAVDETLGRAWDDYVYPDDQVLGRAVFGALVEGEHADNWGEIRMRTSSGGIRWMEFFARLTPGPQGTPIGISGTFIDITERKAAEAERRALEHKLLETQKLESLGVLAGGIAHDFNNLLMAILGNAELVQRELSTKSAVHEPITQIEIAARRAADLTSQMLAYAGKGRLVVQRFDLNMLVAEISALLNVTIAKSTTLQYGLAPQLPAIEGDATQLRQVVMNLVINAAEAIGEAPGTITITTSVRHVDQVYLATMWLAPELPDGDYVVLEVADTGLGMDSVTLAKMFDPFFTTKFTGRGLGLAAVLGIVRSHGGAVKVQSGPGQGTVFTVLLPSVSDMRAAAHEPERLHSPGPLVAQEQIGSLLLVIDDEESVRAVITRILERAGFRVLSAADGRAGLALFHEHADSIAGVLLDLTMPQMNGEDALQAIHQVRPDARVVIMSGYDEQALTERFAPLHPAGFLQKPFNLRTLEEKVQQLLRVSSRPAAERTGREHNESGREQLGCRYEP